MTYTIAVVSGGMDSVTMLYRLLADGHTVDVVSFDYGQRHSKELDSARYFADLHNARHDIITLPIGDVLGGSALTDNRVAVPHGHYAEESMRATVVPNRNAIMLSIAWGIAVARSADYVATAVHAGDHHIYPDCRPAFIDSLNTALRIATEGHRKDRLNILAPYMNVDKTAIAKDGLWLGVPYENTWTCYEGGLFHCGNCGACVERREALGSNDPTQYQIGEKTS